MVSSQKVPRSVQTCTHCQHEVTYTHHAPPKPYEDHQLRAGQVPSRRHTRSAMKQAKAQLRVFQEEVQKMSNALAILKRMEGELREVVARHRTYLAPIRRLPVELLVEIFSWSCSPRRGILYEDTSPAGPFRFTALDISSVCKLWRDVMYSNPRIWTHMLLPTRAHLMVNLRKQDAFLRRLDRCFSAMRGLPLVQTIVDEHLSLPYIVQYSAQWGYLRVSSPSHSLLNTLSHPTRSYTHLHTFDFDVGIFVRRDEEWDDTDFLLEAPALRSIRITNRVDFQYIPRLPWANLSSLETSSTCKYALQILAKCKTLCCWTHSEDADRDPDPEPMVVRPVILPHLQTMYVCSLDAMMCDIPYVKRVDATRLLDHITTPALTKLTLHWEYVDTPAVYTRPYVSSFLARSRCRLRELAMTSIPTSERTYMPTQCDLHTLEYEPWKDMPLSDEDVARFAALSSNGKPLLWPNLSELTLGTVKCRAEALLEMVEARRSAGCPLQCLNIDTSVLPGPNPNEDAVRKLKSLVPYLNIY
ncbi:hypothetical protein K523DRAFT_293160 [Schizophyllum commune Tattone D]|nr:hypothetical protein K523DRAFT_293160 [Schizophyllum commune Tattone D]